MQSIKNARQALIQFTCIEKYELALCKQIANDNGTVKLDGFAGACFDMNTIDDLREALYLNESGCADDCAAWNITENEWRASIKTALVASIMRSNNDSLPEIFA